MEREKQVRGNLEVALLIKDLKEAKKISKVFRKAGIIPYVFENLMDFWSGTLDRVPSLCVIDVECMSDGTNSIVRHPLIQNETLPICFYHEEGATPLMYSCYEIFHFGFVKKSIDYNGSIKDVLRRYNKFYKLETKTRELGELNKTLEKQFTGYINKIENFKESKYYDDKLKNYCSEFEKSIRMYGFFDALEVVFAKNLDVTQYAYYELTKNGQRLVAPPSVSKKYKRLPSLWLGKMCPDGIEYFAQTMANEVVMDLVGSDVMCLLIKGNRKNPEKILFVKVQDEEFLASFNWEFFENYLSGIYSRLEVLNTSKSVDENKIYTPFKLMSTLDNHFFGRVEKRLDMENNDAISRKIDREDEFVLVNVDLTPIVDLVREKMETRFYFDNFFNDFVARMSFSKRIDYKVICFGINHLGFLVDKQFGDDFFSHVRLYVKKYPYWRYFEDQDAVMAVTIKPEVKMIPLSSEAYLRHIEGDATSSWSKKESYSEPPRLNN